MFAIVKITHKQMNNLANTFKDAPKQVTSVEPIVHIDTDGKVQASMLIQLTDNESFEGLHNAVKQMGADSIMFVTGCGVVMESSVHVSSYVPVGFWTEITTMIQPVGDVYHVAGKQFFINEGE